MSQISEYLDFGMLQNHYSDISVQRGSEGICPRLFSVDEETDETS